MRYQRYQTYLENTLGIADTRTPEIAEAMDKLHSALCKLDNENMRKFASMPLYQHLNRFCSDEGVRQLYNYTTEEPFTVSTKIVECHDCRKMLPWQFAEKWNGLYFCSECHSKKQKSLKDGFIVECSECNQRVETHKAYIRNSKVYCEKCAPQD